MLPWLVLLAAALGGAAIAFAGGHKSSPSEVSTASKKPFGPQCTPEKLDASAQLPHTNLTVSPLPGSRDAMPQTQISMLGVPAKDISNVTVTGSSTGEHSGSLRAYSQGDGASFVPDKPFSSGERVTVTGTVREGEGSPQRFSYHFTIGYPDPVAQRPPTPRTEPGPGEVEHFHSAPSLEPPAIDVTYHSPAVAEGDIFLAPYSGASEEGPMIIEGDGQLVWMDPLPAGVKATNLQVQTYEGKPVLTWWQGYIPPQGFGMGEEIVANTSYEVVMRIKAGNGDLVDLHDFHLEPHNTAVFTVFRTLHCNLTSIGGPAEDAVTDALFQEVDLKTGLVRREWDSLDHVALSETYSSTNGTSTSWALDYFHLNTVDPRENGTTLLSARNTSSLYIINDKTGQIITTIGGKKSDVRVGRGAATAFQHDANTLPDGDISIFDNGGAPFSTETTKPGHEYGQTESKGLIVDVNAAAGTDTLLLELKHPRPLQAGSQGDVQLLPNGDWFVGWGQEPYFTEYTSTGELLYDAHMVKDGRESKIESYRVYKFPWKGTPTYPPSIAASPVKGGVEVWASWNGATEVASWRVLGGSSVAALSPLATVARSGFETSARVESVRYVQVQALSSEGEVIGNSKPIEVS